MFPATNQAGTDTEQENSSGVQIEPVACQGWRWALSWLVGNSLASSPSLPLFLMVMVGDFLATMSLCIPYTFLPAMAVAQGIGAQDAAFLISAAGISSTVRLKNFSKTKTTSPSGGSGGRGSSVRPAPPPPNDNHTDRHRRGKLVSQHFETR